LGFGRAAKNGAGGELAIVARVCEVMEGELMRIISA
jgi:hypothetical protein